MGFILASAGNAQNASYQTQYANALNGATATSITLYGSVNTSLNLTTNGSNSSRALTFMLATDTSWRGFFTTWASNQGILIAADQAGNILADLYNNPGTSVLSMDGTFSVNTDLNVTGAMNATAFTIGAAPGVTGTVSIPNQPINGIASELGASANFVGSGAGGYFIGNNVNSTTTWIGAIGPNSATRGFKFDTISSTGVVTTNARADLANGRLNLQRNGIYFGNSGMQLSRQSSATAAVPYHAPSYGFATISHGLGVQPDGAVVVSGDGSSTNADYLLGFDTLGSSTVQIWITLSGGTGYARFNAVKHVG